MQLTLTIDGKKYQVDVEVEEGEEVRQQYPAATSTIQSHPVAPVPPRHVATPAPPAGGPGEEKICRTPVAGVVFKIVAQVGQHLEVNDLLVILEAMKMETNITAHIAGTVDKILVSVGEAVKPGQAIAVFR